MRTFIALALVGLCACVAETEPETGRMVFSTDCAACHGMAAKGDGPLGKSLDIAPPDLTQISGRNGGTFPRVAVMSVIDGLDRDAHFSTAMPEFGAGDLGDTVIVEEQEGLGTPIPIRLLLLTDYLESIQGK